MLCFGCYGMVFLWLPKVWCIRCSDRPLTVALLRICRLHWTRGRHRTGRRYVTWTVADKKIAIKSGFEGRPEDLCFWNNFDQICCFVMFCCRFSANQSDQKQLYHGIFFDPTSRLGSYIFLSTWASFISGVVHSHYSDMVSCVWNPRPQEIAPFWNAPFHFTTLDSGQVLYHQWSCDHEHFSHWVHS